MYLQADLKDIIHRIPWFMDLAPLHIERLASIATLHEVEGGDVIFREGDREDFLYIVLEGQAMVEIEVPSRGQVPIYTAEAWDVIGWSALTPVVRRRTASARTLEPTLLLGLQAQLLAQLCEEDHHLGFLIMKRLSNIVAGRLLATRVQLMDAIVTVKPAAH